MPIGNPANPYGGEFDGGLQPITNLGQMLFGTVNGAQLTHIAIESGIIEANNDYAGATGSIVGWANADSPSALLQSYSKADVHGSGNDAGGLIGKFVGRIEDCYFAGTLVTDATAGGLVGSSNENYGPIQARRCFVYMTEPIQSSANVGSIIGWEHDTSSFIDCFANDGTGVGLYGHNGSISNANILKVSNEDFANGSVAFRFNAERTPAVWYQTLQQDAYPVLDATHSVVLRNDNGQFYNEGNNIASPSLLAPNVRIYDLTGRRRSTIQSGINIVNGRKVFVK